MNKTMKAMAIQQFGPAENLQLMNLPIPEIADDEILLRVKAAGVNHVDSLLRSGVTKDLLSYKFPMILD